MVVGFAVRAPSNARFSPLAAAAGPRRPPPSGGTSTETPWLGGGRLGSLSCFGSGAVPKFVSKEGPFANELGAGGMRVRANERMRRMNRAAAGGLVTACAPTLSRTTTPRSLVRRPAGSRARSAKSFGPKQNSPRSPRPVPIHTRVLNSLVHSGSIDRRPRIVALRIRAPSGNHTPPLSSSFLDALSILPLARAACDSISSASS